MQQKTCNTCIHYRQHDTFDQREIFRVFCGHCTYPKVKTKRPYAKACENYLQCDTEETPFVSKEYLSKTLLEYVLNLELLPEIHNIDDQKQEGG